MVLGKLKIREGNTGILYISQDGKAEQTYIPDSDLEKTRQLLLEFQELKCTNGISLKDNYKSNGFNWYPSMVSFLYWHYFFPYVRYQNLLHDILDKKVIVDFSNKAELCNINRLLTENVNKFKLKYLLFYILLRLNNRLVIKWFPYKMMFFRFAFNDFRSVEIRNELDQLGTNYIQVVPPGRIKEILNTY